MSTNVPHLKQIGGGHLKNGQKIVDLTWNDPHFQCRLVGSFTSPGIDTDRRHQRLLVSHDETLKADMMRH